MAYGLKYSQYLERGGVRLQIKVYQKDYSGASYGMAHITGASLQIVGGQSNILSPTLKTAFSWSMADCWDEGTTRPDGTTCVDATGQKCGKWEEFYTNDATKYKVEVSVVPNEGSAQVIWTGFVTPDSWAENLVYRGSVTITARDMLGALRDIEFNLTGRVSVLDVVRGALAACECPMPLSFTDGHFLVNSNGSSILDHTFAASAFSEDSWQSVLDDVLESLGIVLRYNGANGLVLTSYRYIKADTLLGMHGGEFTGRSGLRSLDPSLKQIVDVFDVEFVSYNAPDPKAEQFARTGGTITCSMTLARPNGQSQTATGQLYAYSLERDGDEGWEGNLAIPMYGTHDGVQARGMFFPTNVTDTQDNIEAVYINPRLDTGFKVSFDQDGPLVLSRMGATSDAVFLPYTGAIVISEIRVRIEATSSGTKYYLNQEGAWVTEKTYITLSLGEELEIPVLNGGGGYKVVVKSVRTAGYSDNVRPVAPLLAALLLNVAPPANSTSPTEYKTTTIYSEENNVTINRTPAIGSASLVGCVDFYENVLALGDVIATNEWNWPGESNYYPLAVMIQAQVLCFHAAAASVFTGTLHDTTADKAAALPGYGIAYYDRDCVPVNGTYDFVSGFVGQAILREVYTWEQVWGESFAPQYTQRSGAGRGSTSATGAGGSSVSPGGGYVPGGGGGSLWEIDDTLPVLVKPKGAYSYVHSRDGLFFTGGDTSTPTPDLYVDTVNNQRVLRSPLPLITGGDQIVLDGTPGGGGGGGGATTLAGLDDTNINNPAATQVLQYLNGKWTNVNSTEVGVTTVATSAANGLMSYSDFNKLAGIATGATAVTESTVSGWGFTKNTGTVTSVKVGSTTYNPTSGLISLPAYLTAHQTVTLASGTNNGTLKLTTAAGTVDNIAVKGLGSMAYESSDSYLPLNGGTLTGELEFSHTVANGACIKYTNTRATSTAGNWGDVVLNIADADGTAMSRIGIYGSQNNLSYLYIGSNASSGVNLRISSTALTWGDNTIWHAGNLTQSVVTGLIGSTTYAPYNANGYLPLSAGASYPLTGRLVINGGNGIQWSATTEMTTMRMIGPNSTYSYDLSWYDGSWWKVYHSGNSNKSGVAWACSTLTANGNITLQGADRSILMGEAGSEAIVLRRNSSGVMLGGGTHQSQATIIYGRPLRFITYSGEATVERMRILANGNVGIGKTDPTTTLYVNGTTYLNGETTIPATASLKIGSATITWNSNGYLYIDKPLVTAGDQIVISGTPGGGGGGGATTLNGLDDVSVSSLANNNVLVWDSTLRSGQGAWKNVAASSIGGVTSVVGQTGAVTAEQIASALTSAGYQLTDTTYSQGTGISISGTTISLASTYAGGTAVTLNGQSKAANTASFYAPTAGGAANKVLIGKGTTSAPDWSGFKLTGTADATYNLANFLTGNQTITLSGDVSGSGTTSINVSIGSGKVTNAMLAGSIAWSKLSVSASDLTSLIGSSTYAPYNANGYLPLNGGTLSGLLLLNYASARIAFQNGSGTTLGVLGVRSAGTLEFYDTVWRTVYHSNNSNLTTVDWTTKALNVNGRLYMKGGNAIEFDNASGTSRGLLSANDSKELLWHDGSWRTVYHSNNSNKSNVAWTCSTLTASGAITERISGGGSILICGASRNDAGGTITFQSTNAAEGGAQIAAVVGGGGYSHQALVFKVSNNSDWTQTWTEAMRITYSGNVGIGTTSPGHKLHVNGGNIYLQGGFFRFDAGQNVQALYSGYAYRLAEMDANGVNHLCYGGNGGVRETRLYGNGIIFYNNSRNQVASLNTSGTFTTTGDQVVSSDLTKKTNLVPINIGIEQIAGAPAVTFDWKTGGHSFGSIAQYWKDVLNEAVLGTEGNYALAYGQLALVNTIVEAREIDKLKARVAELEAEVKRLTAN